MKHYRYLGNSAYCYSNSTAMLLASIGEKIAPSLIEVVGGVGVGAYVLPNSNISFLSGYSGLPDKAISRALRVLGFEFEEKAQNNSENPPFERIKQIIKTSPVVFGPLDMGYLEYDPDHQHHFGIDHFILVYAIDNEITYLHDPAGFPNASLSLKQLELAWKAQNIQYKEGYYRYWALPKRIKNPTVSEIYSKTISNLREIYQTGAKFAEKKERVIDYQAIVFMANNIEKKLLKPSEIGTLTGFILPLGARRASDFADFFQIHNPELSKIKAEQAHLLGLCQRFSVLKDWLIVAKYLKEYSSLETQFKKYFL